MQPLWRTVCRFLKKKKKQLRIKLPNDPAIILLGIYPEKIIIVKDTCTPEFIAALFSVARTWKQLRCLSVDEWIKNVVYMYNRILLSHMKE